MIIRKAELETVCGVTSKLPEHDVPEVAFIGKSNVGKSTLINTLLGRKKLARTSQEPGKTQTINFYNVNDEVYFTDLPGYGYAKVSMKERERWAGMINRYLEKSRSLKLMLLLIDIRHEPGANDIQMFEWLKANNASTIIVLTKADKIKRSQKDKCIKVIRSALKADGYRMIPFSGVTKEGREELLSAIEEVIDEDQTS